VSVEASERARAWERRAAAIDHNATQIGVRGVRVVAGVALAASLLTLVAVGFVVTQVLAFAAPVALALLLRVGVISPAARQVRGMSRKLLLRWVPRLLWLASLSLWAWAVIPWLSIVLLPALWIAQTRLTYVYVRWTVQREVDGLRPHALEWALLVGAALAVAAALFVLFAIGAVGAALAAWWSSGG
jgi:hypothetical protein